MANASWARCEVTVRKMAIIATTARMLVVEMALVSNRGRVHHLSWNVLAFVIRWAMWNMLMAMTMLVVMAYGLPWLC